MRLKNSARSLCVAALVFAVSLPFIRTGVLAAEYQHEHQWQETDRVEPTCEDYGEYTLRCPLCGEEEKFVIRRLGHRFDVPEADKDYPLLGIEKRYCSRCDDYITFKKGAYDEPPVEQPKQPVEAETFDVKDENQLSALGISASELEDYYRDYYGEGLRILNDSHSAFDPEHPEFCEYNHYDPSGQGYVQNGHLCPKYGHSASCTEWGFEMYLPCWKCGRTASQIGGGEDFWYTDPPTGHDFNIGYSYVSPAPTCTQDGLQITPCANNCGAKIAETAPAYGHTYIYEKPYLDGNEKPVPGKVYCEQGDDERNAVIAGSVWKDSLKISEIPYPKFKIKFTNESGKVTEAEYLESSYHGYFAELPSGKYTLTASAEGYSDRTYSVTVEKGKLIDFDVCMEGDIDNTVFPDERAVSQKPDGNDGESNEGFPFALAAASAIALAGVAGGITYAVKRKDKK